VVTLKTDLKKTTFSLQDRGEHGDLERRIVKGAQKRTWSALKGGMWWWKKKTSPPFQGQGGEERHEEVVVQKTKTKWAEEKPRAGM